MSLLRLFVTVAVALPLFLAVGWPHEVWVTFLIALVAVGAGHIAEALVRPREPQRTEVGDATMADIAYQQKQLLRRALAAEGRQEWREAARLFEQLIREGGPSEMLTEASQHLKTARDRLGIVAAQSAPPSGGYEFSVEGTAEALAVLNVRMSLELGAELSATEAENAIELRPNPGRGEGRATLRFADPAALRPEGLTLEADTPALAAECCSGLGIAFPGLRVRVRGAREWIAVAQPVDKLAAALAHQVAQVASGVT
jgi:hypothetical protein